MFSLDSYVSYRIKLSFFSVACQMRPFWFVTFSALLGGIAAFTDVCNAFSSDCITCAQHPSGDCGFCGDGLYAPEDDVQAGARVGGWIFKQRGLESAQDQEDVSASSQSELPAAALSPAQQARQSADLERDHARARAAAALAETALLAEQLHGGNGGSAVSSSKAASRHAVSHGLARLSSKVSSPGAASFLELNAAAGRSSASHGEGGVGQVGAMLSDALAAAAHAARAPLAAAGLHVPAPVPARRPHHFLGCFNRTAAAASPHGGRIASPIARMCRDFRTDACDCEGADKGDRALPACAIVAAEVRTPLAVIVTAFGAAAAVVSAVLLAQAQYMRCAGKR